MAWFGKSMKWIKFDYDDRLSPPNSRLSWFTTCIVSTVSLFSEHVVHALKEKSQFCNPASKLCKSIHAEKLLKAVFKAELSFQTNWFYTTNSPRFLEFCWILRSVLNYMGYVGVVGSWVRGFVPSWVFVG